MNTVKRAIALFFVLIMVFACGCKQADKGVTISSDSFFDRMIIKNDRVYMICYVEFENDADIEKTFTVKGESEEDVKNGLLSSKELQCFILETDEPASVDEDNIEGMLKPAEGVEIGAHSTGKYYVCFVGDHGNGETKNDRNLPKVLIENQ